MRVSRSQNPKRTFHHEAHEEHEVKKLKYNNFQRNICVSCETFNYNNQEDKGEKMSIKFDDLSNRVLGCAIEVHRELGPGLLESTYEQCLAYELIQAGIPFKIQHPIPVAYKQIKLDCGYRVDLFVDDRLIVELKSVEQLLKIHEAQVLTYMKLAHIRIGLLINFNVQILKRGIKRFVL